MTCKLCTCPNCMARYEAEAHEMELERLAKKLDKFWYETRREINTEINTVVEDYEAKCRQRFNGFVVITLGTIVIGGLLLLLARELGFIG